MARRSLRIQNKESGSSRISKPTRSPIASHRNSRSSASGPSKGSRKTASDYDDDDEDDQEQDALNNVKKPARKRAKTGSNTNVEKVDEDERQSSQKKQRVPEQFRKVRGKLGLLQRLAKDVPLDVILEVFADS